MENRAAGVDDLHHVTNDLKAMRTPMDRGGLCRVNPVLALSVIENYHQLLEDLAQDRRLILFRDSRIAGRLETSKIYDL
jgi:hypothetical protein